VSEELQKLCKPFFVATEEMLLSLSAVPSQWQQSAALDMAALLALLAALLDLLGAFT